MTSTRVLIKINILQKYQEEVASGYAFLGNKNAPEALRELFADPVLSAHLGGAMRDASHADLLGIAIFLKTIESSKLAPSADAETPTGQIVAHTPPDSTYDHGHSRTIFDVIGGLGDRLLDDSEYHFAFGMQPPDFTVDDIRGMMSTAAEEALEDSMRWARVTVGVEILYAYLNKKSRNAHSTPSTIL